MAESEMNDLIILATLVASQCVVTPFSVDGVPMLCKTCAKNGQTTSVICVPAKEIADEKSSNSSSRSTIRNRGSSLYNLNLHNARWEDGGVHYLLRL